MELTTRRNNWRSLLGDRRVAGDRIGLVPTMGALHAGHLSLVTAAKERCDYVGLTVFVNPLQFGDLSDLEAYPRDLETDLETAAAAGVDAVFAPSTEEMYPSGQPSTRVEPGPLSTVLEGRSRPGHFAGVATIVTKLFALTGESAAFFGEKDFQQLAIVRKLVEDLELPIEIVGCPIVRETDGLALSSRNRRLSPGERTAAAALSRSLERGQGVFGKILADGSLGRAVEAAEAEMWAELDAEPLVRPDYAVAVDPRTLEGPSGERAPADEGGLRLLVAAGVGPVRLIDNMPALPPSLIP